MNKRKYPPGPEIETIERLMKKRDELKKRNEELMQNVKDWSHQCDKWIATATDLRELLERLYHASIGLMTIDDDDPDSTWLERMLDAKKVMDEVHKELSNGQ